ncbi:anaerobic ribonucleoside-triphosphate reductase [Pseudochelatococcus contaminans]|uniref:Uncharacterized protein n=1 Tax=Pseudochelatococcus contaminans TaxID=1538103 RepID=A0A7W5Z320_9HYPH|nr:anaerobic ribonucleoside-triphosphate reductase [Pseudochelatococcus contaminans]MBB3809213.1 hypothetical protein [Pseudochelatococcus contaminans]
MKNVTNADVTPTADRPNTVALPDDQRQRCEVWTRVMGYHRPVSSFNRGKKGEFHERVYFKEERARRD